MMAPVDSAPAASRSSFVTSETTPSGSPHWKGVYGAEIKRRHPDLGQIDSMIWIDPPARGRPERVLVRSAAALRAARYVGGPWRLALIGQLLPRRVRDLAYDWVARHRHSLAGAPACVVPDPAQRARFLDQDSRKRRPLRFY